MITINAKTKVQKQLAQALDVIYDQVDKSILWFNGASEAELHRLYDVRDLSKIVRDLIITNSRSSILVSKVLLSELRECPRDITKIETKGRTNKVCSGMIAKILKKVNKSCMVFENLISQYNIMNNC